MNRPRGSSQAGIASSSCETDPYAASGPLRALLLLEVVVCDAAALLHFGDVSPGHEQARAALREGVSYLLLLFTLGWTFAHRRSAAVTALAAQAFVLAMTVAGVTADLAAGATSAFDGVYGFAEIAALMAGIRLAWRAALPAFRERPGSRRTRDAGPLEALLSIR